MKRKYVIYSSGEDGYWHEEEKQIYHLPIAEGVLWVPFNIGDDLMLRIIKEL